MSDPAPRAVRVVGRYALYGTIASGGMAAVYLGRLLGPAGFSRTVAIKRLHPQFAQDPEFVAMFLDEARLAARIRHPNVVPTLDVVATHGEAFLVMEYVAGESLSKLVRAAAHRSQRIPPRIASAVMAGALNGLHAAHEAKAESGRPLGIVHRDVSPQNILVGADGIVRTIDFGVAKATGRLQQTREGQLKGKIAYMSPELLHGESATRSSDIYSSGVVFWELLTGERLFRAESEAQVVAKVLAGKIEPPSTMTHGVAQTLHSSTMHSLQALDGIALRALARQPEARFGSAREMAIEIERAVPPASLEEVATFVQDLAGEILAQRAQIVADIESSSAIQIDRAELMDALHPDTVEFPVAGEVTSSRITAAGSSGNLTEAPAEPTEVSFPPSPVPEGKASARRSLLVPILALLGAATVGGGVVWIFAHSPPVQPVRGVASEVSATATPMPMPLSSPSAITSAAPSATGSSSSALASAATSAAARATGHPNTAVPKSPTPPPKPRSTDCNPPYVWDAQGVKHFKPECL
jgi:serine/threonine protein kinase